MKPLTTQDKELKPTKRLKKHISPEEKNINKTTPISPNSAQPQANKKELPTYHDLDHLAGTWTQEEELEFNQNIQVLQQIDPLPWLPTP